MRIEHNYVVPDKLVRLISSRVSACFGSPDSLEENRTSDFVNSDSKLLEMKQQIIATIIAATIETMIE